MRLIQYTQRNKKCALSICLVCFIWLPFNEELLADLVSQLYCFVYSSEVRWCFQSKQRYLSFLLQACETTVIATIYHLEIVSTPYYNKPDAVCRKAILINTGGSTLMMSAVIQPLVNIASFLINKLGRMNLGILTSSFSSTKITKWVLGTERRSTI